MWILSRRTGHWHTPACPQNLCRKENIKKSSIRSHWPCQSILCFTTAPVVATAAPPPSTKAVPMAVFNSPCNKTLCTIQSSKRGKSGSCWFQHLLKSHPLPYKACICITSQSAGIGQGLLPNLFCFSAYRALHRQQSIFVPPIQPSGAKLPALTSSNECHMHDRNTGTWPKWSSVFH